MKTNFRKTEKKQKVLLHPEVEQAAAKLEPAEITLVKRVRQDPDLQPSHATALKLGL